ncbi:Spaf_1101 family AAA-like ATPase [Mesobacillus selenatarsenatis]|uniref:Spaf_1101 family AAA-like ATPase n=1 Tax=Mesobacillus selenatarsenatis TaxID=388741 RepID=UPI000693FEB4|nr:AAA family ATPase [Mesobacillus selenatarsenatis]
MEYDYLSGIVDMINSKRKSYGELKKCEFHFHTPASYDYELIKGSNYHTLSLDEILNFSVLIGYLTNSNKEELIRNMDHYTSEDYFKELKLSGKPFHSFKEYLAYMLIAHKMYQEDIEVAVITDHNTIQGFQKLKYALEEYYQQRIKKFNNKKNPVYLFLGVEISCSEQNHLIAIFNEHKYDKIQSFLDEIIISEEEGTYYTGEYIIKEITGVLDGLAYIAHLNTSNLHGSGLYNKTLFSSNLMHVFGLTNLGSEDAQRNRIWHHDKVASKRLGVIFESDSHSIDTLGVKNTWVKFNKVNFASLKKSFQNHPINIYKIKPNKSNIFIKGMVAYPGDAGFLINKPTKTTEEAFSIDFSRDLNCIIGGRGTGKSTIINIIEVALTLEVNDIKKLEFISRHKKIYILFYYRENDYILEFVPQTKDLEREYYIDNIFLQNALLDNLEGKIHLSPNWVSLYKVDRNSFVKLDSDDSFKILTNIYRRSYSINNIINKINLGKVDEFIRDMVLFRLEGDSFSNILTSIKTISDRSFYKYVRENIDLMLIAVNQRKEKINKQISGFNDEFENLLEIVYSPKLKEDNYYLNNLLENISSNQRILNTYLNWDNVARYIQEFSKKYGFLVFLKLLLKKDFHGLDRKLGISFFANKNEIKYSDIVSEILEVNEKNKFELYKEIYKKISSNRKLIEDTLVSWFEVIDEFTLRFNVNSKELTSTSGSLMKDITEMSLGQKVVAVLTFLFNYGYYTMDNTPLVIDQPEDNLDNQYIYKNLVESLKQIKNNRQVIIVTHNSTIVTNSDTEQVIIMDSNNSKGWIENKGYPSDEKIAKLIVNCLEGGIESFKHKMAIYSLFVKELTN